jgi:hypothetical protein
MNKFSGAESLNFKLVKDVIKQFARDTGKSLRKRRGNQSIPSSTVPFARNERFVGREDVIAAIHEAHPRGTSRYHKRAALFGLGGLGKQRFYGDVWRDDSGTLRKSQIAIEYAYRVREAALLADITITA